MLSLRGGQVCTGVERERVGHRSDFFPLGERMGAVSVSVVGARRVRHVL